MKKNIRTCCYTEGSTSTLNKQDDTSKVNSLALQDLMLQFELQAKLSDDFSEMRQRISGVNDYTLRSTRKALNEYPRLSLDGGRDGMNRPSLGNIEGRRSACCDRRVKGELLQENNELESHSKFRFDEGMSLEGESVVRCKPGVVARLMGLEAMPLPVSNIRSDSKEKIIAVFRIQNRRRKLEWLEF
ncbi:hypothetical protein VNO80_28699 [Phaseolus coccineus]|uniref:DUF3741 domain-containing protein n=1 Tax=Phaseolus coccineus TaxID=3886 RepID=A0AAN9QE91_PHACN